MAGVTAAGITIKTFEECLASMQAFIRGKIGSTLILDEFDPIGNVLASSATELASAWEAVQDSYHAFDPDNAVDDRFVSLSLLSGVKRNAASKGLVTATVNVDPGSTFAPGDLVAHVAGDPDNRWLNRDTVTASGSAVFESEDAGSGAVALSGTLTVIAQSVTGWNSITNAADATPGTDLESIEDLRKRREDSLAASGSATLPAIKADLAAVTGVLDADVIENKTDEYVDGLPPHSLFAVLWDGSTPAADDNEISQALFDSAAAGIRTVGSSSGTATDPDGNSHTIFWSRAAERQVYIEVEIESTTGVLAADVKAAIIAAHEASIGQDVVYNKLTGAVFEVPGVDDWATFTVGFTASPAGTSDLAIADATEIGTLDTSRIVVTGDVT